ncbi:MAG TPA: efflux RND transporter periplasmic adaptor subunit [Burkholderiaceae bacterium]|nr:efflux RND transporter periplasmic adaptor subunit [Burkholderiaceae bacterium]
MRRALPIAAVALAIAAGAGWWLRAGAPASSVPVAAPAPAPVELAAADVFVVAPATLSRGVPLTGTLKPVDQTVVKTKVAGELSVVAAREGTAVRRGQVVARLDATEYEVRVREREATLKAADSQVDQARRTLDNTQRLHDRSFVSQSALDQARSGWEVAVGNRDAAAAQLALARKTFADTVLVAPIDGVVAERFAQAGEKLPVDGRVMSIVDLSRMEIEAPVPAAEVGALRIGQPVTLRVEGVARPQVGRVARIAPGTQAGTRSVPVWIALDNRDPAVRAGLFAQGTLAVETRAGVIAVPQSAIRDVAARTFVYAIDADRLVERELRLGLRDEASGLVEVERGLAVGDRIVGTNLGALRTGAPVRIAPAAGPGAPGAPGVPGTGPGDAAVPAAPPAAAGGPVPTAAAATR